jgi:hypothetical protein
MAVSKFVRIKLVANKPNLAKEYANVALKYGAF